MTLQTITIDGVTLKPGQHFTVPGHGIAPAAIRLGDRIRHPHDGGKVAHAVVYVGKTYSTHESAYPGKYLGDCIQAQPHGVGWTTVEHWQNAGPVYPERRTISDLQSEMAQTYALLTLGWPYGYLVDAMLGLREALGIHESKDLVHDMARFWPKHVECAQLADMVETIGGKLSNFNDGRLPGEVTPGDLWRLFYNNNGVI